MKKNFLIKNTTIALFSFVFILTILVPINASVYNLCLTNGQTVKFSQCNPNIVDRHCTKSVCQFCVAENNGIYCPMSLSACNTNGDCHYLPNTTTPDIIITVTPISPTSPYNTTATSITFSYRVSNSVSTNSCGLYVNDIFIAFNSSRITSSINYIDVDNLLPGSYNWYIKCTSKTGNSSTSGSRSLNIQSDNPNPTNQTNISISLLSPANNTYLSSGILIFNYTISDASNINQCNLVANGNTLATANSNQVITGQNSFSVNMTNGTYDWNIGCTDKSLKIYSTESRFFNVSNETIIVQPTPAPSSGGGGGGGGSGGGGGGGSVCNNKWECSDWSECLTGVQSRTCEYNKTKCKPEATIPIVSQSCEVQVINDTINTENNIPTIVSTNKSPIENLITGASVALNNPKTLWISIVVIVICIVAGYFLLRKGKVTEVGATVVEKVETPVEKEKKNKK